MPADDGLDKFVEATGIARKQKQPRPRRKRAPPGAWLQRAATVAKCAIFSELNVNTKSRLVPRLARRYEFAQGTY